jgi:hypothetical protein
METGILRISVMVRDRQRRLDSFYNVSPDDQENLVAQFREDNPYLANVPIIVEFCHRVKSIL